MKFTRHLSGLLAALSFSMIACTPSFRYINPTTVNLALCDIDSTVTSLYGYEPKENPDLAEFGLGKPEQETYDMARETWKQFEDLCFEQDYKGAYELYNTEGKTGDFLVHLKHSAARFQFDTEVLRPLIYEYEKAGVADSLYLEVMTMEYMLEGLMMHGTVGDTDYIPEQLPMVITEVGGILSSVGRIDEAMEMLDDYVYAIEGLYGNHAFTNFMVACLVSNFHATADDIDSALEAWDDYKTYSREHMSAFSDHEEYDFFMTKAEERIARIRR